MPSRNTRTSKQLVGDTGETRAADYLEQQGVRIIERNFRVKGGEIDLIGRDGDMIAFIEVRQRASSQCGGAAASITSAKQRRLILAARHWLARHGEVPCRFDVIAIDNNQLEWIRAAFSAD